MTKEEIESNIRIGRAILGFAASVGINEWDAGNKVFQAVHGKDSLKIYGIEIEGEGLQTRFNKIIDQLEEKFSPEAKLYGGFNK